MKYRESNSPATLAFEKTQTEEDLGGGGGSSELHSRGAQSSKTHVGYSRFFASAHNSDGGKPTRETGEVEKSLKEEKT